MSDGSTGFDYWQPPKSEPNLESSHVYPATEHEIRRYPIPKPDRLAAIEARLDRMEARLDEMKLWLIEDRLEQP